MKQIIIFPRGQLAAKDREKLTKAGIISLEADDPSKVVTVIPGAPMLSADEFTMAAMQALSGANSLVQADFYKAVNATLAKKANP